MNSSVKTMIGILVVMVAVVGVVTFTSSGNNSATPVTTPSETDAPVVVTDAPTTAPVTAIDLTLPTEIAPTTASGEQTTANATADSTTAPDATNATATTAAQSSDADTIAAAVKALNELKNSTATFSANKKQSINIQLTDCSISAATSIINKVIQGLAGDKDINYTAAGGVLTSKDDGSTISLNEAIPPTNKAFAIDAAGVASVSSTSAGGGTKYTIVLKPESTTLTSPVPTYHSQAMDYLDLASVDLGGLVTITTADINYTGATIEITVDSQGRVTSYHEKMPLNGEGEGKAGILSAGASLEGYLDETWTITY